MWMQGRGYKGKMKVFPVFNSDRICGLVVRVPGYRSRGPEFDSRRYQIFWAVVGLERGPLSLVRINEEFLERKVAAPVQKTEIKGRGDSLRWPRDTLYPLKMALTSPTSGDPSVGIVLACGPKPRSMFFVFNSALRYKDLWRSGGIASCTLNIGMSDQFDTKFLKKRAPSILPRGGWMGLQAGFDLINNGKNRTISRTESR
jgi:hypothetical protein